MNNNNESIVFTKVTKIFGEGDQQTLLFDNLNFVVKQNEFVAITGPSGSGKSTLLYLAGGLLLPTTGSIYVQGVEITSENDRGASEFRNSSIGFIFQSYNLIQSLPAIENVLLPTYFSPLAERSYHERGVDLLNSLGLAEKIYSLPKHLSGGEQQRVAIARALIMEPDIIFADEPTGNLDETNAHLIMSVLGEIHKTGKTIILVTHDPQMANYASCNINLVNGRISPHI